MTPEGSLSKMFMFWSTELDDEQERTEKRENKETSDNSNVNNGYGNDNREI